MDQKTSEKTVDKSTTTAGATTGKPAESSKANTGDTQAPAAPKAKKAAKTAPAKKKAPKSSANNTGTTESKNTQGEGEKAAGSRDAAAAFVGVPAQEVLSFRKNGTRYIVVTRAGQKLTETPEESKARIAEQAARVAAAEKAQA